MILRNYSAVTLIEPLVVISIIALLQSIIIPSFVKAKIKTLEILCKYNLHQQGLVLNERHVRRLL